MTVSKGGNVNWEKFNVKNIIFRNLLTLSTIIWIDERLGENYRMLNSPVRFDPEIAKYIIKNLLLSLKMRDDVAIELCPQLKSAIRFVSRWTRWTTLNTTLDIPDGFQIYYIISNLNRRRHRRVGIFFSSLFSRFRDQIAKYQSGRSRRRPTDATLIRSCKIDEFHLVFLNVFKSSTLICKSINRSVRD